MRMALKEKILGLPKYIIATSFLAMEVFAFIAFSFGSSFVLYGSLTLALSLILILFSIVEIKKRGFSDIIYLLFPLLVFGLITAVGSYMKGHTYLGDFSIADQVFVPISLISTAMCGYLLAINKTFNIKVFLIVIYSALSLLVFINLLANMINFGPFYTLIYKGYYMYYGGKRSAVPVNDMAYTLQGLRFIEVKMSHYVFYPTMLLTSGVMLFKISPKENKKDFLIFAGFTLVALLSLIFVPSKLGLAMIAVNLLVFGYMYLYNRFVKFRKISKILLTIGIIGASILFIIMVLNNQSFAGSFRNIIAGNSILNKLLNTNPIISKYNKMLTDILGANFLGFVVQKEGALTPTLVNYSGSIFFDTFMTSGVIGVAVFSFVTIYSLKSFKKYILEDEHELNIKLTLLAFIIVYFIFSCLFYDGEYGIYYYVNTPYFMSGPFIIVIFLFAYVSSRKYLNYEVKKKEAIENENK